MRLFGGIGRRHRDPHAVGAFLRLEISQGEDPDGEPRAPFVAKKLVGFDPTAYADVAQLVRKHRRRVIAKLGRGKAAREREKNPCKSKPERRTPEREANPDSAAQAQRLRGAGGTEQNRR